MTKATLIRADVLIPRCLTNDLVRKLQRDERISGCGVDLSDLSESSGMCMFNYQCARALERCGYKTVFTPAGDHIGISSGSYDRTEVMRYAFEDMAEFAQDDEHDPTYDIHMLWMDEEELCEWFSAYGKCYERTAPVKWSTSMPMHE